MSLTIWHNPRCSKSRETLALLAAEGQDPEIRLYLQDPPTVGEIAAVLEKLGLAPMDLVRSGEMTFRELGLDKTAEPRLLIEAMASHPILIERPVVIRGARAAIGRPPRAVLDLLG